MGLADIIDRFHKARVAVVGDVMLDVYWEGLSSRLSPEAPIPVLNMSDKKFNIGGAGNVALNISSLGGEVALFGSIADDESGKKLLEILDKRGIKNILCRDSEITTAKIRIIASSGNYGQQIARLDLEKIKPISKKSNKKILLGIRKFNPDLVVVSDYAKGVINERLMDKLKENYDTIIDPKPKNKSFYKNAFLITPNLSEAVEMSGNTEIEKIGKVLQNEFSSIVVLTMGHKGMALFCGDDVKYFPTKAREVVDVCGAGDTVVATLAVSLASGSSLEDAIVLANYGAGIAVEKKGAAAISNSELKKSIYPFFTKRKSLEELVVITENLKKSDKRIVWTNGCFDIFHAGHAYLLNEAKKQGDYLIVGMNDDLSIKKLKGEKRPFNSQENRLITLSNSESVDAVILFSELNASRYLETLKPDIYVKGGDYDFEKINPEERKVINSYGGKIYFVPKLIDESTTKIAENILKKSY